jgi:hypothetical protein
VLVSNDLVYAFNDNTVRQIEVVSTLPNNAGDAYQVLYDDLTVTSPIPEPATWALLAGGLTVLMVTRRRKA